MRLRIAIPLYALALGCTGTIGDVDDTMVDLPNDPNNPNPLDPEINCDEGGHRLVRRLTSDQYRASLVALFDGDTSVPDADVLTDPARRGFKVDANEAVIRDLGAQQLMNHAERVAEWAVDTRIDRLSSCRDLNDANCRRAFIESFGRRAYRRPLESRTVDAYDEMFRAESSFEAGIEAVVATMLQSPHFLYRQEIGERRGGVYELDAYELASNLAYTITNAPPDQALLDAAERGELQTAEDLNREFERLIQSPAGQSNLAHFAEAWLEIEDLPSRAKDESEISFGEDIRQDMLDETRELFLDVFRSGGGMSELFSAEHTFVNDRLRAHYGLSGTGGDEHTRTELDGARDRGVLSHGSILSRHALAFSSSPVMRGFFVRERLLCEHLPSPPAGVDTNIEPIEGGTMTTRERYSEHSTNAACFGCHRRMDPIGFAFENYDAYGRWRDQEHGVPVDTSGSIYYEDKDDIPLDGLESLSQYLATSDQAQTCMTNYVAYYAYGVEGCGVADIDLAAREAGGGFREVLRAAVLSEHFRSRTQ